MSMQFSVPQFTEVEDKIIGPLTLKQFLILAFAGGVIFLLFHLIGNLIFFIIFALPVAGIAAFSAFGSYNGKSLGDLILSGVNFYSEPTSYIFHKQAGSFAPIVKKAPPKSQNNGLMVGLTSEEQVSRLRKLTYILDQNVKSEEELIHDEYKPLGH